MIYWPVFEAIAPPLVVVSYPIPWMPESKGSKLCYKSTILTLGFGSGPDIMLSEFKLFWLAMFWLFSGYEEPAPPWLDPGICIMFVPLVPMIAFMLLFELYCYLLLLILPIVLIVGFVKECPIGEVDDEDWLRSIIAFSLGCSLDGFEDVVRP